MAICRREIQRALTPLLKYACALCRDAELADELVQDTVVKALSANDRPDRAEAFRPWLFAILRNANIDRMRRAQRSAARHEPIDDIDALPGKDARRVEDSMINRLSVREALMHLPELHRDILALVDMAGFSYAEAAATLGIPKGTVMSRLSRARRAM